jgi:CRP-like cAMP-binding protein
MAEVELRSPVSSELLRPLNGLLASLSKETLLRLAPDLHRIPVTVKQFFHRQGQPITDVYFPNDGVASITTILSDGSMVEAATVGDEGMLGFEAIFGAGAVAQGDTLLQVPGSTMEKLNVTAFRLELARGSELQEIMGRYAQALIAQMMHSNACNAIHQVHERCCRWLLQTHDRIHQDEFLLSQEFLAVMLGVRRQSVTVVARTLQNAGFISYIHGRITIRDRAGLEAASCECYQDIRKREARIQQ